jgi:hypothetical protein
VENLPIRLDAFALYEFYCGRQTIENFFNPTSWLFIVLGGKLGSFWIVALVISMCYVFRAWCSVKK